MPARPIRPNREDADTRRDLRPVFLRAAICGLDRGPGAALPRTHRARGLDLCPGLHDRAVSGASGLRPAYQQLMEDARAGTFDVVLAEALDRLSRDQEDVAALYTQLSFAGVKLITLAEGEISELHVGLKGTMNALFLKDLAAKTHRGLRGRIEQGRSGGGLCYGYTVVREIDANGTPVRGGRLAAPDRTHLE